jgi:ABC-2 type transport system permease protein
MLATQAGIMTTMLPSMLLSGFMYPIENMPWPLRLLAALIPARYFIEGLRGILLVGNGLVELWPQALCLTLFAVLMLLASAAAFRRRLA